MQKADLARMYRLFSRIPKGLEPVAAIFKKHVEGEGTKLVAQVTEALNTRKEKDAGARPHACPAQRCACCALSMTDLWKAACLHLAA